MLVLRWDIISLNVGRMKSRRPCRPVLSHINCAYRFRINLYGRGRLVSLCRQRRRAGTVHLAVLLFPFFGKFLIIYKLRRRNMGNRRFLLHVGIHQSQHLFGSLVKSVTLCGWKRNYFRRPFVSNDCGKGSPKLEGIPG